MKVKRLGTRALSIARYRWVDLRLMWGTRLTGLDRVIFHISTLTHRGIRREIYLGGGENES